MLTIHFCTKKINFIAIMHIAKNLYLKRHYTSINAQSFVLWTPIKHIWKQGLYPLFESQQNKVPKRPFSPRISFSDANVWCTPCSKPGFLLILPSNGQSNTPKTLFLKTHWKYINGDRQWWILVGSCEIFCQVFISIKPIAYGVWHFR